MRLTYDPRHNIAYIRLREKRQDVETIRLSDEVNIDIAPDGMLYGIELLNANEQLGAADGGSLVVARRWGVRCSSRSVTGGGCAERIGMRLKVVLEPSTDGHTVYVPSLPGFTSLGHFLTPSGRPVDRWEE